LEIDCVKREVTISEECRRYVWSPILIRSLICGLLSRIDKVSPGIPPANQWANQPLRTAWRAGANFAAHQAQVRTQERESYREMEERMNSLKDFQYGMEANMEERINYIVDKRLQEKATEMEQRVQTLVEERLRESTKPPKKTDAPKSKDPGSTGSA
jgi:hypothetical protein